MNDDFYLQINGQREGPFTLDQLKIRWRTRQGVNKSTLFWQEGLDEWISLSTIQDMLEPARPQATLLTVAAGGRKCPHCKSQQVGRVRGLQGFGEVIIFIVLFCLLIIPAIIYYIYIESVPYCSGCGRRV